ncbi:hypothetical protein EYM_04135 [Ignicoccus islandicus DSM 13165]|uniref:Anaphase-promoting complex subunit 4 WD40 domain-containing protein n=1 Tax=Ignicoccus islandicus DSM 13165 TaxID=940295 RepID=A0A0U2U8S6_9CREN|nr:WD40 repeat domain-containing protein [Ignicoccus islandicus]ALU12468.1 hypothetical protein EYM_04135 [Ignicoccus islandicus DSM 13165]
MDRRILFALSLIAVSTEIVIGLSIDKFWSVKLQGTEGIKFSADGYLGVAGTDGCAYVFDIQGNLRQKVCRTEGMSDVSSFKNIFAFSCYDGYVYVIDPEKGLVGAHFVGFGSSDAITLLSDGYIACKWDCVYYKLGEIRWKLPLHWVENGPAVYMKTVYIPERDLKELLIVSLGNGEIRYRIRFRSPVWHATVCSGNLAVATSNSVYIFEIFDLTKPREILAINASKPFRVSFSPDCNYIAIADASRYLKVYDLKGNLTLSIELSNNATSVDWWSRYIAVALADGTVEVYVIHVPLFKSLSEYFLPILVLPLLLAISGIILYKRKKDSYLKF